MNEHQKSFVRRHLQSLIDKDCDAVEALASSLEILQNEERSTEIINYLKKNGSLSKTLVHFSIIDIDQPLLEVIEKIEQESSSPQISANDILNTDEAIAEIVSLLKLKLTMGLSYALWLLTIATFIFSLIQMKVLPQFETLFMDFGAELPALTQAALDWQHSLFSPALFGLLMIMAVAYLLTVLRLKSSLTLLQGNSLHAKLIKFFPFISSITDYLQAIRWLCGLKILVTSGKSLSESQSLLVNQPKRFNTYLPDINHSLSAAEKIDNLTTEIEYQQNQLELAAEGIVSKTTTKLTTSIMLVVIVYVVFAIFASYLPIFQLGAVV